MSPEVSNCPHCGLLNPLTVTHCVYCRRSLPWAQSIQDKPNIPTILDEDFTWDANWSTRENHIAYGGSGESPCPECGQMSSFALTHCSACGEVLPWQKHAHAEREQEMIETKKQIALQESRDEIRAEIEKARASVKPLSAWVWWVLFITFPTIIALGFFWATHS